MAPEEAFGQFLRDHGAKLEGAPVMDGEKHRIAVEGDKKDKTSGCYVARTDGRPNGCFTNFKQSGQPVKWVHTGQEMGEADRRVLAAQAQENRERAEAVKAEVQKQAGKKAFGLFTNHNQVRFDHPYIQAKGITNNEALRGVKVMSEGDLFVPVRKMNGYTVSGQFIKPNGDKWFLKGGAIKGGMHIVGDKSALDDVRKGRRKQILIAEGYATAASLYEATGKPVVAAFHSGNLKPVAEAIRKASPHATIIIAADNDHALENNVGLDSAYEAAKAVDARVISPRFTDAELSKGLTDWNDLAQSRGDISKIVNAAIDKVAPNRSRESAGLEIA